ncbi:EamA/RhaT family transporter [Streptomyces durbertensis]|uniref:EamA/RhaT family transporter n=1 Tax=Streptomyces durbertensis TaxID=2448886 RepID=A0ABR6EKZ8_9ACTN|nr:EamA/RhaT family transporter [Streptomyces durbertensis]MBB1246007.1 EamA/RhaT family transporter [Streptomyces durbertensis]
MSSSSSGSRFALAAGPLLVLGYCVINSTKSVLEGALVQGLSPEFIAFNAFVVAQLFYFLTLRDKQALRTAVRRCLPDVIMLNISTAVCWIAVLYAFTVLEPAVANSMIIGLGPTLTIVLGFRLRPGTKPLPLELAAAGAMLGAMTYLLVMAHDGASALGDVPTGDLVFGLVMCFLTSLSLSGITFYTRRLGDAGMTVPQMMASRFVVLVAATLVLLVVRDSFGAYSPANVGALLAISLVGVIISLYLLQQGIVRTEPITVSMLFGTNLLITYLTQFLDPRLDQSPHVFLGIAGLCAAMCLGTWARWRHDRQTSRAATPAPTSERVER